MWGRDARNGLNFTERGFGPRGAVGCSDRWHTAVSQLSRARSTGTACSARPGRGVRWFHTGGIFAALLATTPAVAREAMEAARRHGTRISYDLNYRDSLWRANGGLARAREVNRALVPYVDVLFGNEEDFSAALGFEVEGVDAQFKDLETASFRKMIGAVVARSPTSRSWRPRCARRARPASTAGARSPAVGENSTRSRNATWRSWTASAAATRSRRG